MISLIIKNNVEKFFTKKIWFIALIFSIYSVYLKGQVSSLNITYWEFLIYVMTDHYYFLYFLVVIYIFLLFNSLMQNEELIWIRSGTFIKYFTSQVFSVLVISMLFVFLHLLIAAVIGVGLRVENTYTYLAFDVDQFVVGKFKEYYSTPLLATSMVLIYMISGLTFLGTIFLFLKQFLSTRYVILGLVFLYFLMVLSIRSEFDSLIPFVFLNNYIVLHHAFFVLDHYYFVFFLIEMGLIGLMCIIVKKYWYKKFTINVNNRTRKLDLWNISMLFTKGNMTIIIVLSFLSILSILFTYDGITYHDLLIFQFYGHGTGYFDLMDFIRLIVYNGIPLYLLSHFLEKESIDRSSLMTIRLEHKITWLLSIMRSAVVFILIYVFITLSITVIISWILGLPFSEFNYMNDLFKESGVTKVDSSYLFIIIVTSKLLELFFSFLLIFLLFCFTKTATVGFVLLQILYSFSLIDANFVKYIPTGMSSLGRMSEFVGVNGIPYIFSIIILFLATCMLYLLCSKAYKRIFH
jgi:hypothetical protein